MFHSYEWEELPIDDDVIKTSETLSISYNSSVMTDRYTMFEWLTGLEIDDDKNIDNYVEVEYISEQYIQA